MDLKVVELALALLFFMIVLVKSADLVSDSLVQFSKKLKVSTFFVGFVFLSLISSIPEISIVMSSNSVIPELSVGNLLGAKLVMLGLLGGIAVIHLGALKFMGRFGEVEIVSALVMMSLMIIFTLDGNLTILEGLILIFTYFVYVFLLALKFRTLPNIRKGFHISHIKAFRQSINNSHVNISSIAVLIKIFVGGFGAVIASGLIVETAVEIGSLLSISEALIGLLVLSIGTNLTEITVLLTSNIHDEEERKLTTGNIIGSATINSFIYGLLIVMAGGIVLNIRDYIVIVPVMVILSIVIVTFLIFAWTGKKISKFEGWLLLSLYFSFVIVELILLVSR